MCIRDRVYICAKRNFSPESIRTVIVKQTSGRFLWATRYILQQQILPFQLWSTVTQLLTLELIRLKSQNPTQRIRMMNEKAQHDVRDFANCESFPVSYMNESLIGHSQIAQFSVKNRTSKCTWQLFSAQPSHDFLNLRVTFTSCWSDNNRILWQAKIYGGQLSPVPSPAMTLLVTIIVHTSTPVSHISVINTQLTSTGNN